MNYLNELSGKIGAAYKRFPISLIWAVLGSFFCIIVLKIDPDKLFGTYRNIVFTLILGISWLLAARFFVESFKNSNKLWWIDVLVLVLLGLFYWSLPSYSREENDIVFIRWCLYLLAGHIFLFFAPFIHNWNDTAFWNYLKNILIATGRSVLFSLVLYAGLALALAAIDSLFGLRVGSYVYGQIFIFCLGIVNTCIYVSDFPKQVQEHVVLQYNKPLEVFLKFILIPLVALYLVILYCYALKILILWELPEGWISYMITTLAILGFIIQIIINPVRETHPSLLFRKFYPWFYLLLFPLLILLFVAVFRRILEYNFTENRYFILVLSFWVLAMLLYLLLSKKKQLRILPITLFILIMLSSFGPWGAFQVSIKAQVKEFKKIFAEVNPKTKTIAAKDAWRLNDIAGYLADRNELSKIIPVIGFDPKAAFKDFSAYNLGGRILDSLNIKTIYPKATGSRFYHFRTGDPIITEISRFSYFAELDLNQSSKDSAIRLMQEDDSLKVRKNGRTILIFNIGQELLKEVNKYGDDLYNADPKDFEFEFKVRTGDYKIIFTNIEFEIEKGKPRITNANAFLFAAIK